MQVGTSFYQIAVPEVDFGDLQICIRVAQLHSSLKPSQSSYQLSSITPDATHVVRCAGIGTPASVRKLVPAEGCLFVMPDSIPPVVELGNNPKRPVFPGARG